MEPKDILQKAFYIHFLVWNSLHVESNLIDSCSKWSNEQYANIGLHYGSAPDKGKAIIWNHDSIGYRHINATRSGLNGLLQYKPQLRENFCVLVRVWEKRTRAFLLFALYIDSVVQNIWINKSFFNKQLHAPEQKYLGTTQNIVSFIKTLDWFQTTLNQPWYSKVYTQIVKFMGPTWGPPGSSRPQMGLMLAPWTLLSLYVPCVRPPSPYFNSYFMVAIQRRL